MSDQMAPVLQLMQDYVEHHYLDEMMDEIEAVIDMEHKQHLNLGLEQQDDEVLRCVNLLLTAPQEKSSAQLSGAKIGLICVQI